METVDVANGVMGIPIPLSGCEAPAGLAYDKAHARWITSRANHKAAIVDAGARRRIALVDIGAGPDAVVKGKARGLTRLPCGGEGLLELLSTTAATVRRSATDNPEIGTCTGALTPRIGALYPPAAKFSLPIAGVMGPPMLPSTFPILQVRPA